MRKTRTVVLRSEGLLNKWGFSDGDLVADDTGSRHDLLVKLVKKHLLPLLPGVDVDHIVTIHNPIRATKATAHLIVDDISVPVQVEFEEDEE
jgi:hypothetical protein